MKLIFLGAQGSGKSTQAKQIAEKLAVPYIEMGSLLREKAKGSDNESADVRQALAAGNLVPDIIAIKILQERVAKGDCKDGFVLDGYPRNYAQLEGLPQGVDKVFYIKVADDQAIKRLLERNREDDSLDLISRRLEIYHKETEPLLAYFKQQKILEEIDGSKSVEEVTTEIFNKLPNANLKN